MDLRQFRDEITPTADFTLNGDRILVMTAVAVEREAVLRGLQGDARFDVVLAGVGPASAAASTARALAQVKYGLVVSAGIGGAFMGKAEMGSLVVASEIIAADLGVQTPDGFLSVDELGFGFNRIGLDTFRVNRLASALHSAGLPVHVGPILTVTTATGTEKTASELASRVPGATAEAMEGFGVAMAARSWDLPVLEIRSISNVVGPRDREAWRMKEALAALEAASTALVEVIR